MKAAPRGTHPSSQTEAYEPGHASEGERIDLSVIAPCFNEAANVTALVDRLLAVFARRAIRGEIVLVNDGSSDSTGSIIDGIAATHPEVRPLHHRTNQGLSAAWDTGLHAARGMYVCFIDADLQNLPEEVWRLYRDMTQRKADVVQGVRSSVARPKDGRFVLSRGLSIILNLVFGLRATDNKSGFVIAPRETMSNILDRRHTYSLFHVFIRVAAQAKGYSVHEVDTLFQSRAQGKSYIKNIPIRLFALLAVDMVKAIDEYRFRKEIPTGLAAFLRQNSPSRELEPTSDGEKRC